MVILHSFSFRNCLIFRFLFGRVITIIIIPFLSHQCFPPLDIKTPLLFVHENDRTNIICPYFALSISQSNVDILTSIKPTKIKNLLIFGNSMARVQGNEDNIVLTLILSNMILTVSSATSFRQYDWLNDCDCGVPTKRGVMRLQERICNKLEKRAEDE